MNVLAALVLSATFTRSMPRVSSMDPAEARSVYDSHAVQLVYETPLEVDYVARPYRLVPGCCELPNVRADGLIYDLTVRSPRLTAEDVMRAFERLRQSDAVSPNAWIVKDVASVRVRDARTLEIRLSRPCHFFPWLLAMSPLAVRRADGTGTGPYELAFWRKNHEMVFHRRQPNPKGFDVVRYLVIDDPSTQWLMFLKGELDFLDEIPRDNWDAVIGADGQIAPELAAAGMSIHSIPTLEVMFVGFNMRDPVLGTNRALRQALNCAFDYPSWARFCNNRIEPSDGPVPTSVLGHLDSPFPYAFDLAKSRRLLSAAGYPEGIDPKTGRRLTLTLTIGRPSQESREAGELMASFYARVGIKLELSFMTWDAFLKSVNEGHVQMYRMGWVGDYPDAQNFLQLFHSQNASPGPNHSCYANPAYDAAYDAALRAKSVDERMAGWARCQQIIREDCPWVFTHFNKAFSIIRPTVRNYRPTGFPYGMEKYYENAVH